MYWIVLLSLLALASAQDFRTTIEGPILLNNSYYVYYCNILDSLNRPNLYDVVFLFDFAQDPNIPVFTGVRGNDRVALPQQYLEDKMNKQIRCRANNTQASLTAISANYINIGVERAFIKSQRDMPSTCDSCVTESDKDPLDVRFTATVPFRCPDTHLYTKCNISVNLTTTANIVVKGTVADKPCTINFTQSDADNLYHSNVSIYSVNDDFTSPVPRPNYVLMNFPSFANFTANGVTYMDPWNNYRLQTDIRHIDDTRATCTISGISQVSTFDNYNYQHGGVGQFSYVRSKSGSPFEVQLRHWPCALDSETSCVCGVAVQEGLLDVVIDMCIDGVAKYISHSCVIFPTESGAKVISNAQRNRFAIIFPSGNRIYGSIVGREMSIDIYINSYMENLQEGLCGTFNLDMNDDIVQSNNIEQWRLQVNGSIFDGVLKPMPTDVTTLTPVSGQSYCTCTNGVANCSINMNNFDLMDQLTWGMNTNVQPRVPGDFGSCAFRMDASYYSRRYLYYNWMTYSYAFTWPTETGITEAEAEAYCMDVLFTFNPLMRVCTALTQDDRDLIMFKCKLEIQSFGYNESATNIEPELGRLCVSKGAATASGQGMTGLGNLLNISRAYCDSFTCNFHGNCTNGACVCAAGIAASAQSDCAFFSSTRAEFNQLYGDNICDVRTQDCTKFMYYTENADSVFPYCRFLPINFYPGVTNLGARIVPGNDIDDNATMCYTPFDFLTLASYGTDVRIPVAYRGGPLLLNISLGNENNVASQSNAAQLLIYDSYCYNCTNIPTFNCTLKQRDMFTCYINGYCIRNNTVKSGDPGSYCNVDISNSSWVPTPPPIIPTTAGTSTAAGPITGGLAVTTTSAQVAAPVTTKPQIETTVTQVVVTTANRGGVTTVNPVEVDILDQYLRRIAKIPKFNISETNVPQLTTAIVNEVLPNIPGCSNFNTAAGSNLQADPALTLAQNMDTFLKTYCSNTSPQDASDLAAALTVRNAALDAMTTAVTTTSSRSAIQGDLEDFLSVFRNRLTVPQFNVLVTDLVNQINSNPYCAAADAIASTTNPPAWNSSISYKENFINFLNTYCLRTNQTALNETAGKMGGALEAIAGVTEPTSSSSSMDPTTMGAIAAGVLGSIALLALMLTCCCCWPQIYPRLQSCCCPWSAYPACQPKPCPPPACAQPYIPTCAQTCAPEPQPCAPLPRVQQPQCGQAKDCLTPIQIYVRSSPGCVDPCSKPISRNLVPYKDRYCGSTTFAGGCQGTGCNFSSPCGYCKYKSCF